MFKIFYSWQSDLPSGKNRNFIRECIDKAIFLANESEAIEADRDEATKDVTGSPNIVNSLFLKIDDCDLFVADISLCYINEENEKKSPNPNVLVELGYAVHLLGWERIICICNDYYGTPKELPFDIQQNRILRYSLEGQNRKAVMFEVAETIFSDIRALREMLPRAKKGEALHIVGAYDEKTGNVIRSLKPVELEKRQSLNHLDDLLDEAKTLANEIVALSEKMVEEKRFVEETTEMADDETQNLLKSFQLSTGLSNIQEALRKITTMGDFNSKYCKPVEAFETDSMINWLKEFFGMTPDKEFFSFGSLSKMDAFTPFDSPTYYGSEDERAKYSKYCRLYRCLYLLWLQKEFIKTFDGYLFIPIAIQNLFQIMDNNLRIIIELEGAVAVNPTKELITDCLRDHRGYICHFKLIDKLLFLPDNPFVEAEASSSQSPIPRMHFTLRGYERDKENEEDYEYNLKQFILEPVDDTHYSTTLACLRAGESRLLSGGILILPSKEKITINYSIHSAFSTGVIKGSLTYQSKGVLS